MQETSTLETTRTEAFLAEVHRFESVAHATRTASLQRGWGDNAGEISVFASTLAIDTVLDLRTTAAAAELTGAVAHCDEFLASVASRPGAVTTSEVEQFCTALRTTVA
jgi:hypothetical protein